MSTGIEWCDETWGPVLGCTHVSTGCDHCYAATLASGRLKTHPLYEGLAEHGKFTGKIRLVPERLDQPLRWKRPRRIFVNSMSDLFHDDVPGEFILQVFTVMALAPQHQFQILTKRPGRMASLLGRPDFNDHLQKHIKVLVDDPAVPRKIYTRIRARQGARIPLAEWPLPNVWLGTSVENQKWSDVRIPKLLETPAAVRFLSCEPLIGPVSLDRFFWRSYAVGGGIPGEPGEVGIAEERRKGIDWVIVGGESGPEARPMHPDWARSLRDQCVTAGVPFLFKQWGQWQDGSGASRNGAFITGSVVLNDGRVLPWGDMEQEARRAGIRAGEWHLFGPVVMSRVGKKAAGRELDGRTWDQYPVELSVPEVSV